jgi:hypothetical protein
VCRRTNSTGNLVHFGGFKSHIGFFPTPSGIKHFQKELSAYADVLALEGEDPNVIREGVRGALADYEQLFRAQEVNKRMKDKAATAGP